MNSTRVASNQLTSPADAAARRPLRIVHYLPMLNPAEGGVVASVVGWCELLASRGHEMIVVTWGSPDAPRDWDGSPGRPRLVRVPEAPGRNRRLPAEAVKLWEIELTPATVVHLHTIWMASNFQTSAACRRQGVPYVVSIHGMLDDWSMAQSRLKKRTFLLAGGSRYLNAADALHFTAEAEREQAGKWIDTRKAVILPYLVDLAPFHVIEDKNGRSEIPTLLFLSRLHEKKGVHHLLSAAGLLRRQGRQFKLVVAGSAADENRDYERQLHRQAADLGINDVTSFPGLVTGNAKIALYRSADLFVLPTQQENFGLVLIEAMAAGTAVLTTRGTDIWREIAAAGGVICDGTSTGLCDAITRLLEDRAALAEAGRRGRRWVVENLSPEKIAEGFENTYFHLLAARRSAPA